MLGSGLRRGSTSRGGFSFPRRKRKKAPHYLRGAALPAGLEGESPGCDPTRATAQCAPKEGGGHETVSIAALRTLSALSLVSTPLIFERAVVLLIPLHCRDGVDVGLSFRPVERNLRHVDDGFLAS